MTITIETLAIGNMEGPHVYLVVRRYGTHLDIQELPGEEVTNLIDAKRWVCRVFRVSEVEIKVTPVQLVEIEP